MRADWISQSGVCSTARWNHGAAEWRKERVAILNARGLHGGQVSVEDSAGDGNLADAAVSAVMLYRASGPLIDALIAELGMSGGRLNGMLGGAPALSAPAAGGKTIVTSKDA
ncbi:flotillin domain-containing protein [Sphingobium sp. B2]|uniref:flotillin domain-containing protein n=1 Tax=Sphingobium sp. B2 TaxID=2583228 RepID=UPI003965670A